VNDSVTIQFLVIAIAAGTPLLFAAVGEILGERAGVMNLGLEGMMLVGGVTAYATTVATRSLVLGVLAGALAGMALSLPHAVLSISLRANQIVSGIALVIVGTGLSTYIGAVGHPPLTDRTVRVTLKPLMTHGLADLPIVGPVLFGHDALVYASWLFVAVTSWYLFRTRPGLGLRAVGNDPASADACGISVSRVRYAHVLAGGAAAGVAGAYQTLALFGAWQANISAGSGWIAFALVIFSGWRPWRALVAAYLFGAVTSIGFKLQLLQISLPLSVLAALPYLATLVALVIVAKAGAARRLGAPRALGQPFWREAR
jgi:ABC-type uncharacterized transport system permease subunit